MIASIDGKLVKLDAEGALVQVESVGYEVMLPSYCISALSDKIGSNITLCTTEYYEGTPGGGNHPALQPDIAATRSSGIAALRDEQRHSPRASKLGGCPLTASLCETTSNTQQPQGQQP